MGKKRKEVAPPEDESDSEQIVSTSGEDSEQESQDIVNVDFEFFDPKQEDFHGVKALLRTYLEDKEWDLTGFVDLILSQTSVGTVVKAGEDESPIAFITVLNIKRHKEIPAIQSVKEFLLVHGKKHPEFSKLDALLESKENVGLLVSERVFNAPVELCGPLHTGLFDEIAWATEDEPSDALRDSYKFKHYLILTRVYQEVTSSSSSKSRDKLKKKKSWKKAKTNEQTGSLIFIKPEDEIFLELSEWHFTFSGKSEAMLAHETKGMKLLRLVMVVSAKQIDAFKIKLKSLIESES